MSKKKEREERNRQIKESVHKKVLEMKDVFEEITSNRETTEKKEELYQYWVLRIVDSIENRKTFDDEAKECYTKMVELYPATKPLLDDLIKEVQMFSVYDFESNRVNFDFSAYIRKIENLIKG